MSRLWICSALLLSLFALRPGMPVACGQTSTTADDGLVYAGPPRKQDEVFLVNTRSLLEPGVGGIDVELSLSRYSEAEDWEALSVEGFCRDSDPSVTTLVYVHGYDFDEAKAEQMGWAVYHAVCDGLPAQVRLRYVVWSWPSEAKRFRPARDVVDKSLRADAEGYWLAWLLAQLPAEGRVALVGSALGCRAVEGAMHLLGGGEIDGWKVARPDGKPGPSLRAAFISPAVHDDWLYPGEFHDRALGAVEGLLLVNNPLDPTLHNYSRAWRTRPTALGLTGPPSVEKLGELAARIEQIDAQEAIGENHGVEHYLRSAELTNRIGAHLLGTARDR